LRTFYRWLEATDQVTNRALMQVAMPRIPHTLPKPLTVEKAAALVENGTADEDWLSARDVAVMLLLYGAGLRISEALGIARRDAPVSGRDVLRIIGKGGKERLVPILPVTQRAVERYLALCPYPLDATAPLFVGAKGGPLSPRIIQLAIARMRDELSLRTRPHRTRSATRSQRICSQPARTCARSRNCWATRRYPRLRFIPRSTANAFSLFTTPRIRAPEKFSLPPCL
jgi:integrase/recombinase XerC